MGPKAEKLRASKCFPLFRPVSDIRAGVWFALMRSERNFSVHSQHYANYDASFFLDEWRSGFLVLRVRIVSTPYHWEAEQWAW